MSSEIVAALEEERSSESSSSSAAASYSNAPGYIRPFDWLDLTRGTKYTHVSQLTGGDYHTRKFLASEKGHKYITESDPTPDSVGNAIAKMKDPSVLLLRGCDQLFLQPTDFPLAKFKTLTALEISDFAHLTTLPENAISEMTQLENLILSDLPIQHLPDDLFSDLANLRSLILRGCPNLHSLPKLHQLAALELLELSHLLIETLPEEFFPNLKRLRQVSLRGCCKLHSLPSTQPLRILEVLDLSHCTSLQKVDFISNQSLQMLDLSYTALRSLPYPTILTDLTSLYFRDAKVSELDFLEFDCNLKVVDLSGARNVKDVDLLRRSSGCLEALDLSRTGIESIDFISDFNNLHYLILRECTSLVRLPSMEKLTKLEVLDISRCELLNDLPEDLSNLVNMKVLILSGCSSLKKLRDDLFDQMSCLEKLDLSKTNINHLPSFSNLTNLQTLDLSHTLVEQVPDFSNLVSLKEFNINVDCLDPPFIEGQESISKPNEFHLVSTFTSGEHSGFDRFKDHFAMLDDFMSKIQKSIESLSPNGQVFQRHFGSMCSDLRYILENVDLLESSLSFRSSEWLLDGLVDHARMLSPDDFPLGSVNLDQLLRAIVKLKLLVSRKQVDVVVNTNHSRTSKRTIEYLSRIKSDEKDVSDTDADFDNSTTEMQELLCSYESLTDMERNCLLYFAVFPRFSRLKMRILIQLWYGEGFIDPQKNTFEEIGREVFMVLKEKKFIKNGPSLYDGNVWQMHSSSVYSFVRSRAKENRLFDFDNKCFTGSQRACLLKSRNKFPSSCELWGNYVISCSKKLESFETIRTLFNVDDSMVAIRAEWFSKMRNLCVLHLGRWEYENKKPVEVVDLKFSEELKNMKQLRLLSLEGFSTIAKLPDSICKVTNLKILNLRDCSYLAELPDGIGSLKNLTHLDLTDCHILCNLPKGLRLLSELEVLKGFVITYQIGGRQHRNACTLRELLKLEKLRNLTLVVNTEKFPNSEDLQVLKKMKNLCSLKMTWENSYDRDREPRDVVAHSRWRLLKCWEKPTRESDEEEPNDHFDKLKKLVLCCFPFETAPGWLNPSELGKLEKLYIMGGELKSLAGDINQIVWCVKNLRLKYLRNLEMDWEELRAIFSNMTCFARYECDPVSNFPPYFNEWKLESEASKGGGETGVRTEKWK